MNAKAVYWKNGVPVILSDSGSVYSIAVVGSDVYACGVINKGNIEYVQLIGKTERRFRCTIRPGP